MSDTTPFEDVSSEAMRAGIKYPVLIDSQIKKLLETDFRGDGLKWSCPREPLSMYILAPLSFLMTRYPSLTQFLFSIRPKAKDGISRGIPVTATFEKDETRGYFVKVDLDVNASNCNS